MASMFGDDLIPAARFFRYPLSLRLACPGAAADTLWWKRHFFVVDVDANAAVDGDVTASGDNKD